MVLNCSIKNIKYGNKIAVKDVKFTLNKGECLMITGDSGSGKTSLLLFISGLLKNKQVSIDGSCEFFDNPKLIYIAQNPDSNIISNDVMSELILNGSGEISKVVTLINKYKIPYTFLNKKTDELSGGQKQLLAVLSGVLQDVDFYLFDEPTAMLDTENSSMVSEIINQLLIDKKTLLISTHRPEHFNFETKTIELKSPTKIYKEKIFLENTTKQVKNTFSIENLDFFYKKEEPLLKNFNLELTNGDVLLISGKNGSGKTTLAKLMARLLKPKKGTINFNSKNIKKYKNYLPTIFSYSLQNPNWQLLFESVEKEINFCVKKYSKNDPKSHSEILFLLLENTKINKSNEPRELSFGQKKFITNLSFYHDPVIHFFDEPDLGMDEDFNNYFFDYIAYRKEMGLISIIVSHDAHKYKTISTKNINLN